MAFLDSMGDDARERPTPRLQTALAGVGGGLLTLALAALLNEEFKRGTLIAAAALALAVSYALAIKLAQNESARSAAVGVVVVAIPLLAVGLVAPDSPASGTGVAFLSAALYAAAWAFPGHRGKTVLIGFAALILVGAFASLGSVSEDECLNYIYTDNYDAYYENCSFYDSGDFQEELVNALGNQGIVYLVGSAVLLGAVWWLDKNGYRGTATGLVVAGLTSAVAGVGLVVDRFGDTSGPVFIALAGVVICAVGAHGERRATTWWGAAMASGGVVAVLGVMIDPESTADFGTVLLLSGLVLIVGPQAAKAIKASQGQNAGQTPPRPHVP